VSPPPILAMVRRHTQVRKSPAHEWGKRHTVCARRVASWL
jgi:hypothetical protein